MGFEPTTSELEVQRASPLRHSGIQHFGRVIHEVYSSKDDITNTYHHKGSTEIWTRIAGFKVQSANHYTIEPHSEVGAPEQGIAFTVFYYISIVLTQV